MKHFIYLLFSGIILFSSCKSSYRYTEIKPKEVSEVSIENVEFTKDSYENIEIKTAFIGFAADYMIYQVELYNNSDQDISITYRDVDIEYADGFTLNARHKYQFIEQLKDEKQSVKTTKKANTFANILIGGLGIVSIFTGGGNGVDGALYAIETTAYVAEDHRNFNLIEGSIEDEIKYIEDWVLHEDLIPAGEQLSSDIIFPIAESDYDFDIVFELAGGEYRIPYSSIIREGRR